MLKDNKVFYDGSLTNEEMPSDDVTLSFKAEAIQKEGFADVTTAYNAKDAVTITAYTSDNTDEALFNAGRKKSIIIDADIQINDTKKVQMQGNPAYINLNGHTVSNVTDGKTNFMVFLVRPTIGGKVRIENGTIAGTEDFAGGIYGIDVTNWATAYINNVTFENCLTAVQVETGTAYIEGGFFHCVPDTSEEEDPYRYTLNCIDENYEKGRAKIIVTGGTFVNFNPADNHAEGEHTNFVAAGYHVERETQSNGDVWYTVVADTAEETP